MPCLLDVLPLHCAFPELLATLPLKADTKDDPESARKSGDVDSVNTIADDLKWKDHTYLMGAFNETRQVS